MNPGFASAADFLARVTCAGVQSRVPAAHGQVCWWRFGTGSPVVLLHGGHGSWRHWLRNIEPLANEHTVWVPDMPGYGESSDPPQATLASLVDTLHNSLDKLVGSDAWVDLVGFSFGGLVATHLAAQRGRVGRLALLGPAGHGGARRPRGELLSWREAHRQGHAAVLRDVMRHNLLMHMLHDEPSADETALQVHIKSCLGARFHSRSISRMGGLLPQLDAFTGPTLLLWGEHDVTATPATLLPLMLDAHPEREGTIVAGTGHWVQYEAAAQVNAQLARFLGAASRR